jgi:hypothetical protein
MSYLKQLFLQTSTGRKPCGSGVRNRREPPDCDPLTDPAEESALFPYLSPLPFHGRCYNGGEPPQRTASPLPLFFIQLKKLEDKQLFLDIFPDSFAVV